ncbi:SDR family oxidoreductase [Yoonia litorea]|uniref:NAD(P)-dependent dehydrogenase, short-chain alcohol dehydrogenase family n=1 Tax=Yoonia litorea TaxID=1123755 RepID=A0A1I6MG07_9RHOB|nr:SDR family oxidoreductase [Yoonia litorea]SFS14583.1 NAD(P)-dependent dehydrogenase, short-chain alcohol dehydrogenase family [Yoonia litorea]
MKRFVGKRILITGGTSGIGLATAERIVAEGGEVAVTGVTQDHLDDAGRRLPSGSLVLRNDASDPDTAKQLANKIKDQMGEIDGAYLNAGFGQNMAVEDVDAEGFDAMMNVNVRGAALQMAALKPLIKDGGAVLLTASVAPYLGGPKGAIYAATKASCAAMARSWARALADRNIRVNSVAPGPIETNFFDAFGSDDGDADELREQISSNVPLGRMGKAEEVAAVTCFLLSDEAAFVTGSEYMVDGGMTLR